MQENLNTPDVYRKQSSQSLRIMAAIAFISVGFATYGDEWEFTKNENEIDFTFGSDSDQNYTESIVDVLEDNKVEHAKLKKGASEKLLESWLKSAENNSWCADEPHLSVRRADTLLESPDPFTAGFSNSPAKNKDPLDSSEVIGAKLCLDPSSIEIKGEVIKVNLTSDPIIFREGSEGQPSIFMSFLANDASRICIHDKEIMRQDIEADIASIQNSLRSDTNYNVDIVVSESYGVSHPCDD